MSMPISFSVVNLNKETDCYIRVENNQKDGKPMLLLSFLNNQPDNSSPSSTACITGISRWSLQDLGERILEASRKI